VIGQHPVTAITLARGGSKRVPKKNMAFISGKPLIKYTIDQVRGSQFVDRHIVSSDDEEVLQYCEMTGVETHRRSDKNSADTSTSADAIAEVIRDLGIDSHYIVEVMCTNPLKSSADIDGAIAKLNATQADSVVSVVRVWDHHPSRLKYIEDDRLMDFFPEVPESRRQDLTPPAYVRNGSIYAFTLASFVRTGRRLGDDVRPFVMDESRSINIDELIDLEVARIMIERGI
jgi:CMP-N,N'-diacetyllegionaminic acid synthase